jgi:glycosyltransferase involved in cell wall biosynthesis
MKNKKLLIFHVITGFAGGGSETMLSNIIKYNTQEKYVIVALKKKSIKYDKQIKNIIYLNITKNPLSFIIGLIKLIREIKSKQPDLIMSWLYHADFITYIACVISGFNKKKLIWNLRCAYMSRANFPILTRMIRYFLSKISNNIGTILCNSHESLRFHKSINYKNKSWKIIANGFDLNKFKKNHDIKTKLKKKYSINNEKLLCMVARNEPQKNYDFMLKILLFLKKTTKKKIKLILVGKNTKKVNIPKILKKDVIKFGYINNVSKLLNIVDILLLISKGESFPNVIGEAMCMNIPCITNNVGDCRGIMGKSGYVINNLEEKLFTKRINNILDGKSSLSSGRDIIAKKFDVKDICKKYSILFNKL